MVSFAHEKLLDFFFGLRRPLSRNNPDSIVTVVESWSSFLEAKGEIPGKLPVETFSFYSLMERPAPVFWASAHLLVHCLVEQLSVETFSFYSLMGRPAPVFLFSSPLSDRTISCSCIVYLISYLH